jgi:16S rRNA (uracil1498-N3)-methyltransferase
MLIEQQSCEMGDHETSDCSDMARRLFFVPEVHSGRAELRGEEARHLSKVLRVERGQTFEISDNAHRYLAEVEAAHQDLVSFRILEKLAAPEERCRITIAVALIRFDRLETVFEKATELGAHKIVPFASDRSEDGLERAAVKRVARWRKIALESAQQCRRTHLPVVEEPAAFKDVLGSEAEQRLFLDENCRDLLSPASAGSAALIVGPEGGWTERERKAALETGWTAVSLGPRILRAETAAIAGLAILTHASLR